MVADNFEDFLEPGYYRGDFDKKFDKEQQLLFIKNLTNVKEETKNLLLNALEKILELYSGDMYNKRTFLPELYQHDIELLPDAPTELVSKPFQLSGI